MVAWLKIFALTYTIETPIYFAALRRHLHFLGALLVSLVLNLATHPVVWFVLPKIFSNQVNYALFAEAWAVTIEALLLKALDRGLHWGRQGWLWFFGLAFVANGISASVGELLYYFLEKAGIHLV
jgi:hypothetical protein